MLTISIRDGEKYYAARVTPQWAERHNNYAMISLGLTVDKDLSRRAFNALMKTGRVKDVSAEEYQHSGCQSSCIRRGAAQCRW